MTQHAGFSPSAHITMKTPPVGSSRFEVVLTLGLLLAAFVAARALIWVWWRPKSVERRLRGQGLWVSPYRLLVGDTPESLKQSMHAQKSPMPSTSHDIAPRVLPFFHNLKKIHGNVFCTWDGPSPRLVVADPELARDIVSNKFAHFRGPKVRGLLKLLITGLASYDGEKWSKHRKIISPVFHLEKLKRMTPAFSTSTSAMVDKWEKMFASKEHVELDVFRELQNLVGDVISRTAFGSSYEEGCRIFQLQNEQAQLLIMSFRYSMIPGYRFLPTKTNKRVKEIDEEVRALLGAIIDKREEEMKAGVFTDDLLGCLMESNMWELQENGNNKKGILTREEVIEECKIFYFAGQETTSNLLVWTMVLLGMHQTWQERAREEVLRVYGKNKPNFDGLSQLKNVTMILHEVLRLYPPPLFVIRCTDGETKVGNFSLPAETEIFLPMLLMHHDPELWGPDVLEFKPERFAEGILRASKNGKAFFAFGGGPRVCIGQNFALVEAKLAMAMILQRFSFELSSSYVHAPSAVLTLQPKQGAQVVLHRL